MQTRLSPQSRASPTTALGSRIDALIEPPTDSPEDRPVGVAATLLSAFRVASTFCLTTVALLVAWIIGPTIALGWTSTAIESGSMGPAIERGDIVVLRPAQQPLAPTTVIMYDDGSGSIVHRIISVDAELSAYVTRGDANLKNDSAPVPFDSVDGVGTLLVPLLGYPLLWLADGQYVRLLLLVTGTVCVMWQGLAFGSDRPDEAAMPYRSVGPLTALTVGAADIPSELLFPPEVVSRLQRGRRPNA